MAGVEEKIHSSSCPVYIVHMERQEPSAAWQLPGPLSYPNG